MCEITYNPITGDTTGLVINDETIEVIDVAEDYDFTINTINLFAYEENPGIPYVDMEEYLYVLHEGLMYYQVNTNDKFTVEYKVNYSGALFGAYTYSLQIDTTNNSIYYSDFGFGGEFNIAPNIEYNTDVYLADGEYIEGGDLSRLIYLDDYGIETVKEDGVYFIPLYLANLILTGDYLNTYLSQDELYIVDDFYNVQEIFDNDGTRLITDETNLIENTVGYAAFFFDHYYGLKDFFAVESYLEEFTERGWYDAESIEELDALMQQFVFDLDDLHTQIADYGVNGLIVEEVSPDNDSRLIDFYTVYFDDICYLREEPFVFTDYGYYYILEINEFNLEMYDYLSETLVDLIDKPIFIDLACNSGGSLGGVLELAAYLTNGYINLRYMNPYTEEIYSLDYQANASKALSNDFYIITSNMTYSAANLFTSMVKDNGWATIIGTESLGGACSVQYTVFPNNLIMTYSSMMAMLNQDNELIEMGIAPDYYDDYSLSAYETAENIFNYFERYVSASVTDEFTETEISLTINLDWPEENVYDHYEVVVRNKITEEFERFIINTPTLNFSEEFEDGVENYEIYVLVMFEFDGVPLEYVVYFNDTIYSSI